MADTSKNSPSVSQRYKQSGITSARQMNRIGNEINKLSMSQDLTKTPTGYRYGSAAVGKPYPFQVINDSTYSATAEERRVAIRGGLFEVIHAYSASHADTMQVTQLSIDATNPQTTGNFAGTGSLPTELATMTSTTIASQTDSAQCRYIYLIVGNAGIVGELKQASTLFAYVTADSVRPDEAGIDNPSTPGFELDPQSVRVLAKVLNLNGKLTITQEWTGGNIKEVAVGLDTYDGYNRATGQLSKSLFYDEFGRMSLYDFAGQLDGKCLYARNVADDMTLAYHYATLINGSANSNINNIAADIGTSGTYLTWTPQAVAVGPDNATTKGMLEWTTGTSDSVDLSGLIGIWWGGTTVYHDDLNPGLTLTWATNDDHDDRYTPSAELDHGALLGLADDDHDTGDARYLRTNGIASRNNMQAGSMIGDSANANSLSPDLRTLYGIWHSNETDASDSDVTLNSLYSLGGIGATNGIYAEKGSGNQAGYYDDTITNATLANGSEAGKFVNAGGQTVELANGVYAVSATSGRINANDGFTFNTTDGVTGNGFGGGIKTDEAAADSHIVEIAELYL